ncbi:DUF1565 domain-containing protein [Mastigocoleus sp. MO_188.B34]|uniref:DUF1565 domain-containing protein n=1 Tax=Mastigocoleus sp. MO_188.B34 TaxID=3036635 RepID=UPI00261B66C9|nr:DUF1565 domain-containing protein [Mastigocoleus sp. MO_188.B34]MDJ0695377.1 DUF1565 domain-containing protein [Mastigocoleus sp. MO_188.B34]
MAEIIYVNSTIGSDSANGSQQTPLKTITQALKIAKSGTKIQLADSEYNSDTGEEFPLNIPSGVSVIGNEGNKGAGIIIEGSGEYLSRTFARQNITIVLDDNTELRGVTVTSPASRGTAVWIESTAPTVANCTFTKSKREGVFASGNANPKIFDSIFVENDANGISIARDSTGEIRGNSCVRTGYGIAVSDRAAPKIINNKISENRNGIVISGSARPILRQNICERNTDDGLTMIRDSLPDMGNSNDPGGNILRNNGKFDLQNATSNKLIAIGNQIDPSKVKGNVELVDNQSPTPEPNPTPAPNPTPQPNPTPEPEPAPVPIPVPNPTPEPDPAPVPIPVPDPTPLPNPTKLRDISGHWAEIFIQELVKLDIVKGYPDLTFKPDVTMTRAQYAALLVKAFNPPAKREAIKFKDVKENFWANGVIQQAYEGGFLSGFPDRTFHPNQNIQRVQVIVSLVNGLKLLGGVENNLNYFNDRGNIPQYAKEEVATAVEKQLIVNYPNLQQLNPTRDATRAEVAVMVYQALVNDARVGAIDFPYIVSI